MNKSLYVLATSVLVAGCAATTPFVVGTDHPANPDAPAAPASPVSQSLAPGGPADASAKADRPASRAAAGPDAPEHHGHHEIAPPSAGADAPIATKPAARESAKAVYTCPHHPEVVTDKPGACPKCEMKLVQKATPTPGHGGHGGHQ